MTVTVCPGCRQEFDHQAMERVVASLGVKYGKQRHQEECHAQGVRVSLGSPVDHEIHGG